MKTCIKTTGNTTIIELLGKIAFDSGYTMIEHFENIPTLEQDIIVDFKNLEFVGSTSITNFLQTLKKLYKNRSKKPTLINVRTEFQKIIHAIDKEEGFEVQLLSQQKKLTSH